MSIYKYSVNKSNEGVPDKSKATSNAPATRKRAPIYVSSSDDPRYKAYQDSLFLHNSYFKDKEYRHEDDFTLVPITNADRKYISYLNNKAPIYNKNKLKDINVYDEYVYPINDNIKRTVRAYNIFYPILHESHLDDEQRSVVKRLKNEPDIDYFITKEGGEEFYHKQATKQPTYIHKNILPIYRGNVFNDYYKDKENAVEFGDRHIYKNIYRSPNIYYYKKPEREIVVDAEKVKYYPRTISTRTTSLSSNIPQKAEKIPININPPITKETRKENSFIMRINRYPLEINFGDGTGSHKLTLAQFNKMKDEFGIDEGYHHYNPDIINREVFFKMLND